MKRLISTILLAFTHCIRTKDYFHPANGSSDMFTQRKS